MTTSFIDLPRRADMPDAFGITKYENGLVEFIKDADTPLTIALQGEWGSGKTSLMNLLRQRLCEEPGSMYLPVEVNTWEYALMSDPEMTLVSVLDKMIRETSAYSHTGSEKAMKWLKKITRASVRFTGNIMGEGSGDALVEELGNEDAGSSVAMLREELQNYVNKAVGDTQAGKKGFIFFIDDLDRINPPVAVELLELLKNIFSLDKCIFVLAIDYDVVVKGLKPKFGELTDENEREFRSFFDKIIQVPFSMPVSSYEVGDFLLEQLGKIEYLTGEQLKTLSLKRKLSNAANATVGTNPRALKRLLNTLSLIRCINGRHGEKSVSEALKQNPNLYAYLNFAVVAIQVAYPKLYRLLSESPGFDAWGEAEAVRYRLPALAEGLKGELKNQSEFDEEWEQILYRFCEGDPYLKNRAEAISKLLNAMRREIAEGMTDEEEVKGQGGAIFEIISEIVKLSAVTSFDELDAQPIQYNVSWLLKNVQWRLIEAFNKLKPGLNAQSADARVRKNAHIMFGEHWEGSPHFYLWTTPARAGIKVSIGLDGTDAFPLDRIKDLDDFKRNNGTDPVFRKIYDDYAAIARRCNDVDGLTAPHFMDNGFSDRYNHIWRFHFTITGNDTEYFDDPYYYKVLAKELLEVLAVRDRLIDYHKAAFEE